MTRRLHRKIRRKTNYSSRKHYWQHEDQQNGNKQKTKIGRKSTLDVLSDILHEKTWTWQRKGDLEWETEYLLIAAQNNTIKTNHIIARIDKTQQNSRFRLCGDRDETINQIIHIYQPLRSGQIGHKVNF